MELGKRIKKLRLKAGLNAKELAAISGVTRSLISELETGKRQSTSIDTITRLAKALKVSPSYFFDPNLATAKVVYTVSPDTRDFLMQEDSEPYLRLAQKARELDLPPNLVEELLDVIARLRGGRTHAQS